MVRALALCGLAACSFHPGSLRPGDGGPVDAPPADVATADAPAIDAPSIDAPTPDAPPDSTDANGYQKPITVQRAMVAGDVTGFPVWITLTGDPDLILHAQDDHSDVYFTDEAGTAIPYEITGWSRTNGILQAWVRATHLTPSAATPDPNLIYLRFGGGTAPMASNGPAVFDNGFAAVWHLETATATVPDASGHANGTIGGTAPASTTGQLGQGLQFSAASSQITFTNPISGGGATTISAWVDEGTISGTAYATAIVALGMANMNKARWFYSWDSAASGSIAAGLYSDDELPNPAHAVTAGTWTKLDWVMGPGAASTLYINGRSVDSKTLATPMTMSTAGVIGNAPAAYAPAGKTMAFSGVLDEVRIANTNRSANWLLTEYNNQGSPGTFYLVGTAQPL
jgi:hypothetical protein